MSKELFLIDSNSLMTPHLTFYPFDFAQSFWAQMESRIKNGSIIILDMVKDEILQGNDSLRDWMKTIEIGTYIDHRQSSVIGKYSDVLQHLQGNNCYKNSALMEWSKNTVADPWLIATAAAYGYTIISFEAPNKGLNPRNPSKNAKIPDIAALFGVPVQNLYYMMRKLGFSL